MSKHPQFAFTLTGDHLKGRLRVDHIQDQAVIAMATEWLEADTNGTTGEAAVTDAVDDLAGALQRGCRIEQQDELVDAVESAAGMGAAEVTFDLRTALRLRQELDTVIKALARFGGAVALPGQRGAA